MYGFIAKYLIRRSDYIISNIRPFKYKFINNLHLKNKPTLSWGQNNSCCNHFRNYVTCYNKHTDDVRQSFEALEVAYKDEARVYSQTILNILENENFELQNNEDILLLQCCGYAIPDQTAPNRVKLLESVWSKLKESGIDFNIQHYIVYLQMLIENRVNLDFEEFLTRMKCAPNDEIYRLLLECACEVGNVQQALKIVEVMKTKNIPADQRLFNALVLGHAIKGGLNDATNVLNTMQMTRVQSQPETYFSLIRGLATRSDLEEFFDALKKYSMVVEEAELLKLMLILGLNGNYTCLKEILSILGVNSLSKKGISQLEEICIHLIHSGQPDVAYKYYTTFVEPSDGEDERLYGFFLLQEMIRSSTPSKIILNIIEDMQTKELNLSVLEKITGFALERGYHAIAWELFESLPHLRPHYFWPFFLATRKQEGEAGVLNIVKKMLGWNVKPDLDTLQYYIIPFSDTRYPKQLILRLQNLGLTIRELLTPLLAYLIKENKLKNALQLYKEYENVFVQPERLLPILAKIWLFTEDTECVIRILKNICSAHGASGEYPGQFLLRALKSCRSSGNHQKFVDLLKVMRVNKLHISNMSADSLYYYLLKLAGSQTVQNDDTRKLIESLISPTENQIYSSIPHPRDMNVTELENHLIELQSKNMETRGVLRRLIQEHSRVGNQNRVKELRDHFTEIGYSETPGMKGSLLNTYIMNKSTADAFSVYQDIKIEHPTFHLDSFKVVDLATLLVTNNQFDEAVNILDSESKNRKVKGGAGLVRNCWRLLQAAGEEGRTKKLYKLLAERGYCEPTNIILGPLVRVHLNKNDLEQAVNVYKECAEKHRCTPLQLELLCAIVKTENMKLLQDVLNISANVHGSANSAIMLISALAECHLHKPLRKFLIDSRVVNKNDIEHRCKRWVQENKLSALETLARAIHRLPSSIIDISLVHHSIMQIHSINNDCESAVAFYRELLSKEENVSQKIVDELLRLTNRCKYVTNETLQSSRAKDKI